MKNLKFNLYVKLGIIFFIVILLLVPVSMIKNLIRERQMLQQQAVNDISSKWGNPQTISGPVITIPFFQYEKKVNEENETVIVKYKNMLHILPENLNISGIVYPQKKHRGIYETVVYNSDLKITGNFVIPETENLNIKQQDIDYKNIKITLGISDLRGIDEQIYLNCNGEKILFNPGSSSKNLIASGVNAEISEIKNGNYDFQIYLKIKGSDNLYFIPAGKTTTVNIKSEWKNPSFGGAFLPSHKITDKGFSANWKVLNLNRNFPQIWKNDEFNFADSRFGVDLLLPVDNYRKVMRTVKYAVLFIVFTFISFFFVEVLKKKFIHPVQYILVAAALIIFYLLLLSITEQTSYNTAFFISASATLILISTYIKTVLKSTNLMLSVSGILTILYTFIFVIIQMQEYSLLTGSIGLFITAAVIMFLSRKIDWYEINTEIKKQKNESS